MAIDIVDDMPSVSFKAFRRIVSKPAADIRLVGIDRNAVIVVQGDQFAKAENAGERADFVRQTFHETTVSDIHVSVMIDDV